MDRLTKDFKEQLLSLIASFGKEPDLRVLCEEKGLTREGGKRLIWERNGFNRNWPRWLGGVVSNCPHQEVNRYLISNMYEEGVADTRVGTDHNELHMRLGEALGLTRKQINDYEASPTTVAAMSYWEDVSRPRPWLEGFTALVCLEIRTSQRAMGTHFQPKRVRSSEAWAKLGIEAGALKTSTNHEAADEDHGYEALTLLSKYADTEEKQGIVLRMTRESLTV
jgi:pyrroloquinoline-quinone synthase